MPLAFERVHAEPVGRVFTPKGIKGLVKLVRSQSESMRILERFRPDIVFGTGGYVAAPILMAQKKRKGPYVLHEQNAVAGRANKMLGKHAALICLTFEKAASDFKNKNIVVSGMPLREDAIQCELSQADARVHFGLAADKWTVLVLGGSQGAQAINEAVLSAVQHMPTGSVQWLHVTGDKHEAQVRESAKNLGLNGNHVVRGFLTGPEVGMAFRAADTAIVRCGSGTLNETLAWGLPSIMVPLPTAANNHQAINAQVLSDAGAGRVCKQSAISPSLLSEWIETWRSQPEELAKASKAARALFRPNAEELIVDKLEAIAGATPRSTTAGRMVS